METWPSKFPAVLAADFKPQVVSSVIRSTMDAGNVVQRGHFTTATAQVSVKWRMSLSQYNAFTAWFLYRISNGADWFMIALPETGESSVPGDSFLNMVKARFVGGYSPSYSPRDFKLVEATLEFYAKPGMSDSQLTAYLSS